jgi:hypothetical protein
MDAVENAIRLEDMTPQEIAGAFEVDLAEAEFMLALAKGEIDGDVEAIE